MGASANLPAVGTLPPDWRRGANRDGPTGCIPTDAPPDSSDDPPLVTTAETGDRLAGRYRFSLVAQEVGNGGLVSWIAIERPDPIPSWSSLAPAHDAVLSDFDPDLGVFWIGDARPRQQLVVVANLPVPTCRSDRDRPRDSDIRASAAACFEMAPKAAWRVVESKTQGVYRLVPDVEPQRTVARSGAAAHEQQRKQDEQAQACAAHAA